MVNPSNELGNKSDLTNHTPQKRTLGVWDRLRPKRAGAAPTSASAALSAVPRSARRWGRLSLLPCKDATQTTARDGGRAAGRIDVGPPLSGSSPASARASLPVGPHTRNDGHHFCRDQLPGSDKATIKPKSSQEIIDDLIGN